MIRENKGGDPVVALQAVLSRNRIPGRDFRLPHNISTWQSTVMLRVDLKWSARINLAFK